MESYILIHWRTNILRTMSAERPQSCLSLKHGLKKNSGVVPRKQNEIMSKQTTNHDPILVILVGTLSLNIQAPLACVSINSKLLSKLEQWRGHAIIHDFHRLNRVLAAHCLTNIGHLLATGPLKFWSPLESYTSNSAQHSKIRQALSKLFLGELFFIISTTLSITIRPITSHFSTIYFLDFWPTRYSSLSIYQ